MRTMFNLLRMDLRRLFRSRSFYIILTVAAALILGLVMLVNTMTDQRVLDAMESQGAEIEKSDYEMRAEFETMSQLDFAYECLSSGFLLMLTGIGVTLFVHSDFLSGFAKNICFARPRRWEYVLSKVLTAGVYSGVLTVLGVLLALVCPALFGLHPVPSPVGHILQYVFWMWLPNWAFGLMGLTLVLLTRGSTLGIILAVISGGGVIATLVHTLCQQLGWYDFSQYLLSAVVKAQCVPVPGTGQVDMILACAIDWAVFYAIGSLILMENRDI